jgi:hypothetical protein
MSTISVGTTNVNSFIVSTDTTGNLVLQTAGTTTALTLDSSQNATFAANVSVRTSGGTYTDVASGVAKAWARFVLSGTLIVRGSFNVSSVTRNGTGDYKINFTTAMTSTNYVTIGNAGVVEAAASSTPTYVRPYAYQTSNTSIGTGYASGGTQALYDYEVGVSVFSS